MLTYVYSNYKKFKINNYKSSKDYSKLNLSIDTINDFNEIKKLLKQSRKDIIDISYLELIRLNEKINFAVIGAGVGYHHASAIFNNKNCNLKYICEKDKNKIQFLKNFLTQ